MCDSQTILTHIHGLLGDKDQTIVGPMCLSENELAVADGQATIHVEIFANEGRRTRSSMVHAHVTTRLQPDSSSELDACDLPACVVGIDSVHKMALFDVARAWVDLVSGPIFSTLAGRCVLDAHMLELPVHDGVTKSVGYVGPVGFRFEDLPAESQINEAPLFQDALTIASPREVQLAKVTLDGAAGPAWQHSIEINGHEAGYQDGNWQGLAEKTHGGIAIRFAMLQTGKLENWISRRQSLDAAIRKYIAMHTSVADESIDQQFIQQAEDPQLALAITELLPSVCIRLVFGDKIRHWPNVYHYVRPGGVLDPPTRLMSNIAFARAMGLSQTLLGEECIAGVKNCAMTSAELNVINEALHQGSKMENLQLLPLAIPTDDATEQDLQIAMQKLVDQMPRPAKPWWRFW